MIQTPTPVPKQPKQKVQSKLFQLIFQLPQLKQQIENYQDLHSKIQSIIIQLSNQSKINPQEIERVCKSNSKLFAVARLLRQHVPPKGMKDNYWVLVAGIVNMFTLMMTSAKMIEFFNKLNVSFSVYRILLRAYNMYGKFAFFQKTQVEKSLKFVLKMLSIRSKNFPRLYASLILNILNDYSEKSVQDGPNRNKQPDGSIRTVISIALDLIKLNLKLSAESGILVSLYRKAVENDLSESATTQMIENIAQLMNIKQNRDIILNHLDLNRVFALFTNVDLKFKEVKDRDRERDEKMGRVERCAFMIEMLLSHCSTLFYFIYEKVTLKNFVISLKSKSKSEKQLSIINQKIFKRLIDKASRYDRNKMQRSNNIFGLSSNYLNYRALLALSYFLDSTQLFQIYLNTDPNGSLFADLGKLSLMYFPITFEKGKYNKQIIQTIKLPSVSGYERLNKDFLNILSYYDSCIIPYEYSKNELISYLLQIKLGEKDFAKLELSEQNQNIIQDLLARAKQVTPQQFPKLLLQFYKLVMKICQTLQWHPSYLKLCKYISFIVGNLRNHDYQAIFCACMDVVNSIFYETKPNYFRYLYIIALDDLGKYFQDHESVQELILSHYKDYRYAFKISRILLHVDLNRVEMLETRSHKILLKTICESGCEELILQIIEILRFYCVDNDDKVDWGTTLISQKLIYSHCQEIASAAVQFCQQFLINHRTHKSNLNRINLANIKDHNLRKRVMYLLLNNERGIDILNAYNPSFIKDEIDLWTKQGHNNIKQLSMLLSKQSKKFTTNKDAVYMDIGKVSQNRHKLIFLPWNVLINDKCFVALASHKYLEEKVKLRIMPELLVETKIELVYADIGDFPVVFTNQARSGNNVGGNMEARNTISVKRQEIIKYYDRSKLKQNKQVKKFAVSKQNTTFYFKYEAGCLVLQKVIIDIALTRDVYKFIGYPLSFISLVMVTGHGQNEIKRQKFLQQCIEFCRYREDRLEKDIDLELTKGAMQCLGLLFSCWKLELIQKIEICSVVIEVFEKTMNFQLKEVALWVLNIIVKDDDMRRKVREHKGWLILESKYCGWLCYPQFYNQEEFSDKPINQFAHIPTLLQRPDKQKTKNQPYQMIQSVLQMVSKTQNDSYVLNDRKNLMYEYFRKVQNRDKTWDPKLLEKVVLYLSAVNVGIQQTQMLLELFTSYYLSDKFDLDFPFGSSMP